MLTPKLTTAPALPAEPTADCDGVMDERSLAIDAMDVDMDMGAG